MMTPSELHELLQTLKGKNSFDVNIAETKKTIRKELVAYRSDQPNPPLHVMVPYPKDRKDIVFYSFLAVRDRAPWCGPTSAVTGASRGPASHSSSSPTQPRAETGQPVGERRGYQRKGTGESDPV